MEVRIEAATRGHHAECILAHRLRFSKVTSLRPLVPMVAPPLRIRLAVRMHLIYHLLDSTADWSSHADRPPVHASERSQVVCHSREAMRHRPMLRPHGARWSDHAIGSCSPSTLAYCEILECS